jgi:hypothetical protein
MDKYLNKIKAAKLASRDILRAKWITNLLGEKRPLEAELKNIAEAVVSANHSLALVAYDLKVATTTEHPDLADFTKEFEAATERNTKTLKRLDDNKVAVEKTLAEIDEKIAKVASGELKVSYDNMIEGAKGLLAASFETDFVAGNYDGIDAE